MMQRFYVPDIDSSARSIILDGAVARQLKTVLRVGVGEHIRVFDGSGMEWELEIGDIGRNDVSTTLVSAIKSTPEPSSSVTMLLGLARPERIELAIQKCTELGAVRFIPVISERVQGGSTGAPSVKRLERWQRIAIEAAEQSGRAIVPTVETPQLLMAAVSEAIEKQPLLCMWEEVADQSQHLRTALHSLENAPTSELAALIGPPGGFSEQEAGGIQEAGATLVTLGPRVLRSETAAITVLSAILYELGDFGG